VDAIKSVDTNHLITVGHNALHALLPSNEQLDFVSHHSYPSVCITTGVILPFSCEKLYFCQDRLGTNIGKPFKRLSGLQDETGNSSCTAAAFYNITAVPKTLDIMANLFADQPITYGAFRKWPFSIGKVAVFHQKRQKTAENGRNRPFQTDYFAKTGSGETSASETQKTWAVSPGRFSCR
jgi:hypothetical protein